MIPIPPIQWVKLLQKRMLLGKASISVRIDDPVVVKPDTDSKKAFVKEGMAPEKIKGKHPTKLIYNHEKVTRKKASFRFIESSASFFVTKKKEKPIVPEINEAYKKGIILSEYTKATPAEIRNAAVTIYEILLIKFSINCQFNIRFMLEISFSFYSGKIDKDSISRI